MRTEKDMVGQLKKGHHNALAALMSKYQNYVYSILISMLERHEAEEATQDTFIKIFKHINQYNEKSKLTTWIYSIAYRTGLDYIKKRKVHLPLEETSYDSKAYRCVDQLERDDLKKFIFQEMRKLDPADAVLIRLYYLNEYSVQEVAVITGLSPSNVKVKLFRTRNILKDRMSHLKLSDLIN